MVITEEYRGMKCRRLGDSGLWVSEVGLGLWKYGDPSYDKSRVGEHTGFKILDRALELGIFFWDTANSYNLGSGNSERLIGRYFASKSKTVRDRVILATKVTGSVREEYQEQAEFTPNQSGASRVYIVNAVTDCLKRLRTNYIDILYLHGPNVDENGEYRTSLDETWGAMDDLISQGKVRYLGVSNYTTNQIEDAINALNKVAKDSSRRIIAVQNCYNLIERDKVSGMQEGGIEQTFINFCQRKNIGIIPYTPLARGLLTGRYRRSNLDKVQGRVIEENLEQLLVKHLKIIEILNEIAREKQITLAQLAIAWLLTHKQISSVIAGVTKIEQLEDNAKAANVNLTKGDLNTLEEKTLKS